MTRTSVGGLSDDPAKWIMLASAMAGVGLLPKNWQNALGAVGVVLLAIKYLK